MRTLTVAEVFDLQPKQAELLYDPHSIYVVKDEGVVLYVGRSAQPIIRLGEHFGLYPFRYSGSTFGTFYQDYGDQSDSWVIELYTIEECASLVKQHFDVGIQKSDEKASELAELAIWKREYTVILRGRGMLDCIPR